MIRIKTFSERFKTLRENMGWTQDDAAERFGVSRSTIAGYESSIKGRVPREELLFKIADTFNVSIDYLLGHTDEPNAASDLSEFTDEEIESYESLIADIKNGISIEDLMNKYAIRAEGKLVTPEEWQGMIAWLKTYRGMHP